MSYIANQSSIAFKNNKLPSVSSLPGYASSRIVAIHILIVVLYPTEQAMRCCLEQCLDLQGPLLAVQ